jgi:hypothetical protein
MAFVKNVSEKKIIHCIEGEPVVFEPGKLVPFKERSMAVFHCSMSEVTASPADGRKGSRPLVLVENNQVDDKELQAQATPDKVVPMAPTPSTFVPPVPGHVAKPDADTAAHNARKALKKCDKDLLVMWAKKHGIYKPYMDRQRMVDALAAVGFSPPTEYQR